MSTDFLEHELSGSICTSAGSTVKGTASSSESLLYSICVLVVPKSMANSKTLLPCFTLRKSGTSTPLAIELVTSR